MPRLLSDVREQIHLCFREGGTPSIARVAHLLGCSARTLQRRLSDTKTSYRTELDAVRCELADSYFRQAALRIRDIANRLGYADTRAFERAFIRWNGITPSQFRDEIGGGRILD